MTRLEVIARPETLEQLQGQLSDLGHNGITVTEVWGSGQPERTGRFRGSAFRIRLARQLKVELVLPDPMVEDRAPKAALMEVIRRGHALSTVNGTGMRAAARDSMKAAVLTDEMAIDLQRVMAVVLAADPMASNEARATACAPKAGLRTPIAVRAAMVIA